MLLQLRSINSDLARADLCHRCGMERWDPKALPANWWLSRLWVVCQHWVTSPGSKVRISHGDGVGSCISFRTGCSISTEDRHWEVRNSFSSQWDWSQLIQTFQCPTHTRFLSWEVDLAWRYTGQLCFSRAILIYENFSHPLMAVLSSW